MGAPTKTCKGGRTAPRSISARALCVAAPLVYAFLGLSSIAAHNHEVFPFFCWFLFPVTPNEVVRYGLELQAIAGRPLQPPVAYEAWTDAGVRRNSMDLQMAVQALGAAVAENDAGGVETLRSRIESNYLRAPCSYRLVRREYEPIVAWYDPSRQFEAPVAAFTCGRP